MYKASKPSSCTKSACETLKRLIRVRSYDPRPDARVGAPNEPGLQGTGKAPWSGGHGNNRRNQPQRRHHAIARCGAHHGCHPGAHFGPVLEGRRQTEQLQNARNGRGAGLVFLS